MQHPNSGISATTNVIIIKNWDWKSILRYYQKKAHKGNLWYKQLPSQTAQETCKQLDKAWRSFYVLKKTGGIKDPNPPRFKQDNIPVTYMQMGIRHEKGSDQLRLSLSKDLKSYMEETYGIHEKFLYLENKIFRDMDHIKQLRIYPPENGKCDLIVIYEIEEPEQISQNGHYLSIDLGLHNLMTVMILEMAGLLSWEESIFLWKDIFIKKSPGCSLYGMCSNRKEE